MMALATAKHIHIKEEYHDSITGAGIGMGQAVQEGDELRVSSYQRTLRTSWERQIRFL